MSARFDGHKQQGTVGSKTVPRFLESGRNEVSLPRGTHVSPRLAALHLTRYRYMMLIDGEDDVYFFDRDDNVFKVNGLRFVHKKDLRRHLTATLIDGVSIHLFDILCVHEPTHDQIFIKNVFFINRFKCVCFFKYILCWDFSSFQTNSFEHFILIESSHLYLN